MEKSPFRTSDLGLAAYLHYKGFTLVGCMESGEQGRLFFIFEDAPGRDDAIESWTTGRADGGITKKYNASLRYCKRELKNPVA